MFRNIIASTLRSRGGLEAAHSKALGVVAFEKRYFIVCQGVVFKAPKFYRESYK
jgi:hypothetical protein